MTGRTIKGTVALVTGANRGIGGAIAEALLERGARKVYATARDPKTVEGLKQRYGSRVVLLQLDVTRADQVAEIARLAPDVELLFNNAGLATMTELSSEAVVDRARSEIEVNYLGPLRLVQRLAPTLARNGGGAVVNVASIAGLANLLMIPTYSASKAALHSLTQAARVLLAAQGTLVCGVYPGPVDTDMSRELQVPKTPACDVAHAILDGVEVGQEEIFPDPFAADFGRRYEASPKAAELYFASMTSSQVA